MCSGIVRCRVVFQGPLVGLRSGTGRVRDLLSLRVIGLGGLGLWLRALIFAIGILYLCRCLQNPCLDLLFFGLIALLHGQGYMDPPLRQIDRRRLRPSCSCWGPSYCFEMS